MLLLTITESEISSKNVLEQTKGVRDLPPELLAELGKYCAVDTNLCREIFDKMRVKLPEAEFDQIDLTLRMFCQPTVVLDLPLVQKALDEEITARQAKIDATGLTHKELRSDLSLALALVDADLPPEEVPVKHSVKQKKTVFAFAKGDLAFTALKEHPSAKIRALVEGRLAAKTSYGESRALRFLEAGKGGRPWPILLNYCGAHTTRWTGGDRMNPQNLKRGGVLRNAVMAPPGYVIMACDSSQIEARVVSWLANHHEMLQAFRDWDAGTGPDVYKLMASVIYSKPIEEITAEERFIGKVVVLGAGYGMGADKYRYTLAAGTMGKPVDISEEESKKVIKAYRATNEPYGKLWKQMDYLLYYMLEGHREEFKSMVITKEQILLPNGLCLFYPNLDADKEGGTGTYSNYTYGKYQSKIYGGLLTENVTQALARVIVADQMLAISKRYRVVTMTHDEVVCLVKEEEAKEASEFMVAEMRKTPSWCTDLPLNAQVEYGQRYS
jgi:DNA polymerase bacteriophage-type